MKVKGAAVVAAVAALALTGCQTETGANAGGSAGAPATSKPTSASTSTSTQTSTPAAPTDTGTGTRGDGSPAGIAKWGSTYTSPPTKRKITATTPKAWTPSSTAAKDGPWTKWAKTTITIDNGSDKPFDTSDLMFDATAGDKPTDQVYDSESNVGSESRVVLPGRKLTFDVGFGYEPGKPLTMEVASLSETIVTFDGVVR